MGLIEQTLKAEAEELHRNGVKLSFIGDRERLPVSLRTLSTRLERRESPPITQLRLVVALSYGGRQAVVRAARQLAERVRAGEMEPSDIDEAALAAELQASGGGPPSEPDLVLRTGGRHRLSNFLSFESAYAEFKVTETLWPDFRADELASALTDYAGRSRTFGGRPSEP